MLLFSATDYSSADYETNIEGSWAVSTDAQGNMNLIASPETNWSDVLTAISQWIQSPTAQGSWSITRG